GEKVTWRFSATFSESLHFYIFKDGVKFFEGQFSKSDSYSRILSNPGHYTFYIIAHYSTGDEVSREDYFDVVLPSVSSDKHNYLIQDTAVFSFNAPGSDNLHFYIYKDNIKWFEGQFSSGETYTRTFTDKLNYAGDYYCYIVAHYGDENFESEKYYFSVTVKKFECDDCVWVLQSVTTPATCISCGEGIYICEVCGKEKTDEICIDPTCHSSDLNCRIIQKATCEKDGKYEYRCPDCGEVVSAGKLNKKPTHDFTSWSEWEEESNGSSVRHRDCKNCGYKETQYIPGISAGKSIDLISLFRILFERIFALFDIYLKKI
ncbi:MAG: hypothetical protein IJL77_04525, partial [Clostridia bacterium]|nr:hypothetical protein [Clostridia bacterium]